MIKEKEKRGRWRDDSYKNTSVWCSFFLFVEIVLLVKRVVVVGGVGTRMER
eukprot:GDKH01009569.1.p2 GENE.GDKH01009569.1~~GDKH01009569.1.p2  ORF type:complete len:51 (-),score=1.57 GDKH01009569.1:103-255(-)